MTTPASQSSPVPVLELHGVGLQYQRRRFGHRTTKHQVLQDIDLNLYHGETVGIIGRNGNGKTSLLQVMGGVIEPDGGQIIRRCNSISLLGIKAGLVPWLDGRRNAVLCGLLLNHSQQEVQAKMQEIRDFSGLGDAFEAPVRTYSSGMRARLGFSIAVACLPDVLLIDEALGVGDREFMKQSSKRMRELVQSDRTVVLVSHVEAVIRELCDRAILIENGKIAAHGDVDAVYARYKSGQKASRPQPV